jgi:hypothetical protein
VVFIIVALAVLVLLLTLPKGREQARLLGCQKNLSQIGVALALYDQMHQRLPSVAMLPGVDGPAPAGFPGPLRTLLETLQLPDLTALDDRQSPPDPRPGQVPHETRVPGFVCASDPSAIAGVFTAPISYRAATGDTPEGDNGAFAIGRVIRLQNIEDTDGLSFTAAFSERLVGDNQNNHPAIGNYRVVPGPVAAPGCPASDAGTGAGWRGDAGSTWSWSDARYTLYNHALPPSALSSCVAADGKTALMGASSGHLRGFNMLLTDGSVSVVTRSINPKVWKNYARIGP